ncbi:RnfABCDGE type electron transport complex subunit B [Defluviitalea phaphyphila]|uniref:RnfABCDGE type electron transport complex subunit B n=1 Tax=Defluviitalea phaphyphila TaxID=1473580 RepID=UPI0007308351|nr:RnfABCDGE type electron transport complex subunit B [Defluviitalea phaphyphila]
MDITSIIYPVISIGGLGLLFGTGLGYASKKFAVEVDERIPQVRDLLPGANCGGCGFAGCDAFAKAVVEGKVTPEGCPVNNSESIEKIASLMGLKVEQGEKKVAVVKCNGTCENSKNKYEYYGITDCRDAALIPGGGAKSCSYGCLGLGTCKKVCPFGAIEIENGIAVINEDKCTACGNCVDACPKAVIELVPIKNRVRVLCNSQDKGKDVKQSCSVGCIGCRMCVKACEYDAIDFNNNLAHIKYDKCTQCMACVKKCPTKAIQGQLLSKDDNISA